MPLRAAAASTPDGQVITLTAATLDVLRVLVDGDQPQHAGQLAAAPVAR